MSKVKKNKVMSKGGNKVMNKGRRRRLVFKKEEIMKKKAVLVDIDGTLVKITENWSMDRDLEWVEETKKAVGYKVAVELVKRFKEQGYVIIVVTARGQSCYGATKMKFEELGINKLVDVMIHRPEKLINAKSSVYKNEMIKFLKKYYEIVFSMEDEKGNQAMMKKHGIEIIDATMWHRVECNCTSCKGKGK
jgi:hydroxymethylpyrimidine pyrophosphatase-like HAD family hydrolase